MKPLNWYWNQAKGLVRQLMTRLWRLCSTVCTCCASKPFATVRSDIGIAEGQDAV